jgi:hypothetical protein
MFTRTGQWRGGKKHPTFAAPKFGSIPIRLFHGMVAAFKLLRIHPELVCLLVFADASRYRNSSPATGTPSVPAFAYPFG